jgi:hypothetical protein
VSVEPGEVGLTPLEGTGDGIDEHVKDRSTQLTAGLRMSWMPLMT